MAELNADRHEGYPGSAEPVVLGDQLLRAVRRNGIGMAFVLGGSVLRIREARLAGRIGGAIIAW